MQAKGIKGKSPVQGLTEFDEQILLLTWFRLQFPKWENDFFAIPNGGYRRPAEAVRLKRSGVKAGVPDLFLELPRKPYHGLRIEMKAKKRSSELCTNKHDQPNEWKWIFGGYL